jgi:hypothetical protein
VEIFPNGWLFVYAPIVNLKAIFGTFAREISMKNEHEYTKELEQYLNTLTEDELMTWFLTNSIAREVKND